MKNFKLALTTFLLLAVLPTNFNNLHARGEERGGNREGGQNTERPGAAGAAHRNNSYSNYNGNRAAYNLGANHASNEGVNGAVIYSQPQNPTYVVPPSNQMPQ